MRKRPRGGQFVAGFSVSFVCFSVVVALMVCLCVGCVESAREKGAIEVKVVVVTMFEIGSDSGDTAGEFQLWHERANLKGPPALCSRTRPLLESQNRGAWHR